VTPNDNFTPSPESALKLVRRMVAEKRAEQKKMVEEYKSNPKKRELFEKLRQENEQRGTPIVKI
jgi:hypothetical protein